MRELKYGVAMDDWEPFEAVLELVPCEEVVRLEVKDQVYHPLRVRHFRVIQAEVPVFLLSIRLLLV